MINIKPGNMKNKIHLLFAGILFTGVSFGQTTVEGVKQFRYEKPTAAEQTFRQVLAKNPSDLEAFYWLARIALATDSPGKVVSVPPVPDNVKEQPLAKVVEGIISLK